MSPKVVDPTSGNLLEEYLDQGDLADQITGGDDDHVRVAEDLGAKQIRIQGPGGDVVFPWTPDEIRVTVNGRTQQVSLIDQDVEAGTGSTPTTFSWDSVLPGRHRKRLIEGRALQGRWSPPHDLARRLERWTEDQDVVHLTIGGTRHQKVETRITSFDYAYAGGHGDIRYSIELHEHTDIVIERRKGKKKKKGKRKRRTITGSIGGTLTMKGADSVSPDGAKVTYTVKAGDTLPLISKTFLGEIGRWREIQAENQLADPEDLLEGTVLAITIE